MTEKSRAVDTGERKKASNDIGCGNGKGTGERTLGVWLLKPKLKAHHKINPGIRPPTQCFHNGSTFCFAETVRGENIHHFRFFGSCLLLNFLLFAQTLTRIMLVIAASSQIAAQSHRYRACCNLSQS